MVVWRYWGETNVTIRGRSCHDAMPCQHGFNGRRNELSGHRLSDFMPHLPPASSPIGTTYLPEGAGNHRLLTARPGSFPTFDNVDTFNHRLMRTDMLAGSVVAAALQGRLPD